MKKNFKIIISSDLGGVIFENNNKKKKQNDKEESNDKESRIGCLSIIWVIWLLTEQVSAIIFGFLFLLYIFVFKNRIVSRKYFNEYRNHEEIVQEKQRLQEEIEKEKKHAEHKMNNEIEKVNKQIMELEQKKQEIQIYININAEDYEMIKVTPKFDEDITSSELKTQLELAKVSEKELIKNKKAIIPIKDETSTKKHQDQLLRTFNTESDYYLSNVTYRNVDSHRKKIVKSYDILNNLFKSDNVQISRELLELKLEQLEITYNYQLKVETEKELLKAQKEEVREQQKVERELQKEKRKIEKEERQFNNELNKMIDYLSKSNSDIERNIYAEKIKELEEKIKILEKDKENVLEREANTRAGFVYIISNIGSFGENIYKIGMTRRLEPMDRIKELASASVPFEFDVHAMIFSEDAPALENTLHNHFRDYEINKVNPRKEFFKVNLDEIKDLVHKKFNNTVQFVDEPEASQYRETLRILENQPQE